MLRLVPTARAAARRFTRAVSDAPPMWYQEAPRWLAEAPRWLHSPPPPPELPIGWVLVVLVAWWYLPGSYERNQLKEIKEAVREITTVLKAQDAALEEKLRRESQRRR